MADIDSKCLNSILNMGLALAPLPQWMEEYEVPLVGEAIRLAAAMASTILDDCPHPPNVASDEAPPRKFTHKLRQLRDGWQDQTLEASLADWDELMMIMGDWFVGMTGASPGAWRDKKARTPASGPYAGFYAGSGGTIEEERLLPY